MNIYINRIQSLSFSNKYTDIITHAISRANCKKDAQNLLGYVEKHHILPKSFKMGGEKDKANFAYLSAKEHFICHLLLPKMLSDSILKRKMANALVKFKYSKNYPIRITSKIYNYIKRIYSENMRGAKRKPMADQTKEKIGNKNRGRIIGPSWNKGIKMSIEFCSNVSAAQKLRISTKGKKKSNTEFKKGSIPHNAINKEYYFISPSGQIFKTDNVTRFCKPRNLSPQAMCAVARQGKGWNQYKGWRYSTPTDSAIIEIHNIE